MPTETSLYDRWKDQRRQVLVPDGFAANVMAGIERQAPAPQHELPPGFIQMSGHLMRWSAAAGLVGLGLFRLLYIAVNLLGSHLCILY